MNPTRSQWQYILSDDPAYNPDFYDAHHVQVPYCSGDVHTGTVVAPTSEHWGLYFSGHVNFELILKHLLAAVPALRGARRVLLTGVSAGGFGAFANCDFTQSLLAGAGVGAQVSCAPSAGWFVPGFTDDHADPLDAPSTWQDWSAGRVTPFNPFPWSLWQSYMNEDCVAALAPAGEPWKCGSVNVMYPHIRAPVYAMEFWFDKNQITNHAGMPVELVGSRQGDEYMAYYGRAMNRSMGQVVRHPRGKSGDGLFLASCLAHGLSLTHQEKQVRVQGHGAFESLADWFFGRGKVPSLLVDDCEQPAPGLPCNPTCPGKKPLGARLSIVI